MPADSATTWVHLTTNLGLEDLVEEEVRRRAAAEGLDLRQIQQRPHGRPGHVRIELGGGPAELRALAMPLRSVHHVLRPLADLQLTDGDPLARIHDRAAALDAPELDAALDAGHRFAVRCTRRGTHSFGSPDVERVVGAAIRSRREIPVDLGDPDLRVRVEVIDDQVEISVQYTDKALSVRRPRPYRPRTALRANLGWAMCVLTLGFDAAPALVADPCCGSGTVLLEAAALWPGARLRAGDAYERSVRGVAENLDDAGLDDRAEVREEDVRAIGTTWRDLAPVDALITNPPWGVRLGRRLDMGEWYEHMLLASAGAVPPGGRLCFLVLKRGTFTRALDRVGGLRRIHTRVVEAGGLHPAVYVLERG